MPKAKNLPVALLLLLLLLHPVYHGREANPPPLIRLHVRAHSDAPQDQALKYRVRDSVLFACRGQLVTARTVTEAQELLMSLLPEVRQAAVLAVQEAGFSYPVQVELKETEFPTRLYGSRLYRAGRYNALNVLIGEAAGRNWWCVMFPPLCFVQMPGEPSQAVAVSPASPPRLRSRLLEWCHRLLSRRACPFGGCQAGLPSCG